MNKPNIAIIVAGGKGERMNATIPKQFLEIKDKPILMRTLECFYNFDKSMRLILVLPELQVNFWNGLCKKYAFTINHEIVFGGTTRFNSVKNGLEVIKTPSIIAIHDGVRPLVSHETIARCFNSAKEYGSAIPVIDLVDSIREVSETENKSVDRSSYKLVQTPQVFDGDLLLKAYEQEFSPLFTDDASVVENLGNNIHLVEGNRENIKITTEFDLKIADLFCLK